MPTAQSRPDPPGRLSAEPGLAPGDLAQVEALAAACTAFDGGRLKLEWRTLRSRPAGELNDFLWIHPQAGVVGFLGLYGFRPDQVEICGMVHPDHRRQGIFSRLFDAALAELQGRGTPKALLVVDRSFASGSAFARSRGADVEHSEHRMVLVREPETAAADPLVATRAAELSDAPFILGCIAEAFDVPVGNLEDEELEVLARRHPGTFVIERAGEPVGTIRVESDGTGAGIYGFAVVPAWRGRGIGGQVLSELVSGLLSDGYDRVGLEVETENDSALHLYRRCGFEVTGTEDYYALAIPPLA